MLTGFWHAACPIDTVLTLLCDCFEGIDSLQARLVRVRSDDELCGPQSAAQGKRSSEGAFCMPPSKKPAELHAHCFVHGVMATFSQIALGLARTVIL